MKTRMFFQYLASGQVMPDDRTLPAGVTEISNSACVPSIGDIVTMQVCYPPEKKDCFESFRVVGKNYFYVKNSNDGALSSCEIYVIVTDVAEDVPGVIFKE